MAEFDAVVVGGSAGALAVLRILLPALPRELSIPMIVVVHLPPGPRSLMPEILEGDCDLRVKEAEDKEPLERGTIYLAPPGYHVLVEANRTLSLSADEPVHFSRPSIDVLFESAADVFGARLLGVLLTGGSQDGAAGMKKIRFAGGTTVVQSPETAEHARMPAEAIAACTPSTVLPAEDIARLFASLEGGTLDG